MKKLLVVSVLVLGLVFGCAGLKFNPAGITMEFLIEKSRSCEPDSNGWRVLSVPDKNYITNNIEFVFFTKNEDWGVGIVVSGKDGGSIALIYSKETDSWVFAQNGTIIPITSEDAKEVLKEFWEIAKVNMDLDKMGTFKLRRSPDTNI